MNLTPLQKQSLAIAAKAAKTAESETGCPSALSLAQWCLESAWGAAQPGNNCFGIKWYPGGPGKQLLRTREWFNDAELKAFLARGEGRTAVAIQPIQKKKNGRTLYRVEDLFAAFPSIAKCFERHGELLTTGRSYAAAFAAYVQTKDLRQFVQSISKSYATDPDYAERIQTLMDASELKQALAQA